MRVYLLARFYEVRDVRTRDAAQWFVRWLLDYRNHALGDQIQHWLWQPVDAGGLGGIAESPDDIARLRAAVVKMLDRP